MPQPDAITPAEILPDRLAATIVQMLAGSIGPVLGEQREAIVALAGELAKFGEGLQHLQARIQAMQVELAGFQQRAEKRTH